MLTASAPGTRGHLVFVGFVPSDLEHFSRLQPISIDGKTVGLPGKQLVMMREDDPMIAMYLQFPIVVIRIRHELLATIQADAGFVQVPLAGSGFADNTFAMFYFAPDDAGLIARLEATKLTSPELAIHGTPRGTAAPTASPDVPARRPSWFTPILCTTLAIVLALLPAIVHVDRIGALLAGVLVFAAAAALTFYSTARARTTNRS